MLSLRLYTGKKAEGNGISKKGSQVCMKTGKTALTNLRFGFDDTKMAKGSVKPFMISV